MSNSDQKKNEETLRQMEDILTRTKMLTEYEIALGVLRDISYPTIIREEKSKRVKAKLKLWEIQLGRIQLQTLKSPKGNKI